MSFQTTVSRAGKEQLQVMLQYMEHHDLFARGQIMALGASGHVKYKLMWTKLSKQLNDLGPSYKTESQWEKCWKNLRLSAKEKKAKFLTSLRRTGNEGEIVSLSDFEERICAIFGDYGIGLNIIAELGVRNKKLTDIEDNEHFSPNEIVNVKNVQFFTSFNDNTETMHVDDVKHTCNSKQPSVETLNHESEKQRSRSNKGQLNFLIAFMERNSTFAKGIIMDPILYDQEWSELATDLNSITGQNRSVESWQRTWKDQVRTARERKNDYLSYKRMQPLTDQDKRILLAVGETLPARKEKSSSMKRTYSELNDKEENDSFDSIATKKRPFISKASTSFTDEVDENDSYRSNMMTKRRPNVSETLSPQDLQNEETHSPPSLKHFLNTPWKQKSYGVKQESLKEESINRSKILPSLTAEITISDDDENDDVEEEEKPFPYLHNNGKVDATNPTSLFGSITKGTKNKAPFKSNKVYEKSNVPSRTANMQDSSIQKELIEACVTMLLEACKSIQTEIQKGFQSLNFNINAMIGQMVNLLMDQQSNQEKTGTNDPNALKLPNQFEEPSDEIDYKMDESNEPNDFNESCNSNDFEAEYLNEELLHELLNEE